MRDSESIGGRKSLPTITKNSSKRNIITQSGKPLAWTAVTQAKGKKVVTCDVLRCGVVCGKVWDGPEPIGQCQNQGRSAAWAGPARVEPQSTPELRQALNEAAA